MSVLTNENPNFFFGSGSEGEKSEYLCSRSDAACGRDEASESRSKNMKMKKLHRLGAAAILLIGVVSCQKDLLVVVQESSNNRTDEWIERTKDFRDRYQLEEMVVLSRHNIRSPLSGSGVLSRVTPHQWFEWTSKPSELSVKGGELETMMGSFFRQWALDEGLIQTRFSPGADQVRIYANSLQRTQATAQFFSDAMFPGAGFKPEIHETLGTMDPVFNPVTTGVDEAFRAEALAQIASLGGENGMEGIGAKVSGEMALIERVIDIRDSPAAEHDTTSFKRNDVAITIQEGKEPSMTGGLKMACSVSDALVLQYYEEPSDKAASFGHYLRFEEWTEVAAVKDWYQDVLFTTPAVSKNVARPLLKEIRKELSLSERKFAYLCGHDSNLGSVLAALDCEDYLAPNALERKTPIGSKVVFEKWKGSDGVEYVDILLVYASALQLRNKSRVTLFAPPMAMRLVLSGLPINRDGLYTLADLQALIASVTE